MAIAKVKKRFFPVEIPILSKETNLLGFNINELDGKFLKYDLTRMLRGKSVLARFKVEVKEEKASAKPVEISVLPYFIKRMVRKGTSYIEDSFSAEAADSIIQLKPLLISRRKISRAVRKELRKTAREELTKYIQKKNSEVLFNELLRGQLQKDLSGILKKVYPLSLCEIRNFKVEKFLDKKEKPVEEKKAEEPKEDQLEGKAQTPEKKTTEKEDEEKKKDEKVKSDIKKKKEAAEKKK